MARSSLPTAFARISQMGAGWRHIWPEFIHLVILIILGLIVMYYRMKRLILKEVAADGE